MFSLKGVRIQRVETYEDGSSIVIESHDIPITGEDPFVRARFGDSVDEPSEIITEYAPAPERPPTYPAELPFVRNTQAVTTEFPNGPTGPGVRWVTSDSASVMAIAVDSSIAHGWTPDRRIDSPKPGEARVILRKDRAERWLIVIEQHGIEIVQLVDFPADAQS